MHGEHQADSASDEAEDGAFEEEFAGDAAASGAEGCAKGKFLTAAFDADEKKIGDVGADDEHHEADRAHHNPKNISDVADDVLFERANLADRCVRSQRA